METNATFPRKYSVISYIALAVGITCFFITFVQPTRIVMIGSLAGDYITYGFTTIGLVCSIIGISKKTEKNMLPIISLILSLSFPI
ncbi:hypothetical protein ACFVR1_14485 [Psychrobacillus sp. NPDC058041]|uniref:hypothetical protein n=1 Tax=Psychrobacillus sp. NPDC058041 TaxID=3346310 RepID=UPI0036DA1694